MTAHTGMAGAGVDERILVTGLGGAVGTALAARLPALGGSAELVGVFSGERSRDRFLATADPALTAILRAVVCDLTDETATRRLADELGGCERALVVHAAANTAWTLALPEAVRANVVATRNVSELARATARRARLIYVSSAFTHTTDWIYRNSYEESKALAERMLRVDYPDLATSVFSCSLVVGDSGTGAITRFHGIYPLIAAIERFDLPVVPGEAANRIDIVPVDWVADELLGLMVDVRAGATPRDVVAAAGDAAPTLTELVSGVVAALNRNRALRGTAALGPASVLGLRQFDFLRRSLTVWRDGARGVPDLRLLDRLIASYRPYLRDGHARAPFGVSRPAPSYLDYLDPVVTYWLSTTVPPARREIAVPATA
ncbi:SDR family oxidoreductase [Micromonospora sp. WMMD1082]|uniref:SDR family oxidoreductase n=1 Tax=Micromonospora sp. WMMD1082 TaxID=3016104 RepID=UPI002417AD4D|nr:SDR family oxidoreductase [Micromonospora sp. WMMD1082]MDG4794543.1 SDR family oxidoreductase [Micromonospora sp. WMMD1082]